MCGRKYQVYAYRKEDYLLILEAVIRTLETEWVKKQDESALRRLKSLQREYDLLMLGVLLQETWEAIRSLD